MSLKEYARKRDFRQTAEPVARRARRSQSRFVVQKHAATRLHYDFRLELDGTLKSWAVPKGIPLAHGEKRLAVEVEDHPVSYIDFEGTIPKGQYGGGTVMVWDRGHYEAESASPAKELESGKLHFTLHGQKLRGEWYLVRMRDDKQWLLIRKGDDLTLSRQQEESSALSGKSMLQLGNGTAAPALLGSVKPRPAAPPKPAAASSAFWFIPPMLARPVDSPPVGEWSYEIKFDGFRALAWKSGDSVQLLSRNEKNFNARFPEVVESVAKLKADTAILDGEIVALDAAGRSSFQMLQSRDLDPKPPPIYFYAFDLLLLNGENLQNLPLRERQRRLTLLLKKPPGIVRCSSSLGTNAPRLLAKIRPLGLEGLIGKKPESVYEPGRRSGAWIKIKLRAEQEFVIGGYTDPEGSRPHFGALLIGYFQNEALRFAGKVGTGFNAKLLASLHQRFRRLGQERCPFANLPEKRRGPHGAGVTAAEMRRCHWLKPELVAQVTFTEWTQEGKLRHPVFLGLREDKNADLVVRETPT